MEIQHFIKYEWGFLNQLTLESTGVTELDAVCQGDLKKYLLNKNSFIIAGQSSMSELAMLKTDIENTYKLFISIILPKYNEVNQMKTPLQRTITETITNENGDENITNSSFEPVINNTQKMTKLNNQTISSENDISNTSRNETYTTDKQLEYVRDFYEGIQLQVEEMFEQYVNCYDFLDDEECIEWCKLHTERGNIIC